MCNCYTDYCAESGCSKCLPVHIGDFIVPSSTIEVRCGAHPPPSWEPGWVAFESTCSDDCDTCEEDCSRVMYMRYIGDNPRMVNEVGRGITPNTGHHEPVGSRGF